MFGIVLPLPKPSLVYKCQKCGHKFKILYGFINRKKCPFCGNKKLKLVIGTVEENFKVVVH
jgi:putative FmdB family regulatory protein